MRLDGLSESTWFTAENKFTLDYVCMDGWGLKKYVSASVLHRGEVIGSDHAAIKVMERGDGNTQEEENGKKNRWLNKLKWEEFGRQMNEMECENMPEMNSMMVKEDCETEEQDNWQEDRGWMTDDIGASTDGRKERNMEYRKMIRIYGANVERTQMAKIRYMQKYSLRVNLYDSA